MDPGIICFILSRRNQPIVTTTSKININNPNNTNNSVNTLLKTLLEKINDQSNIH